MYIQLNSQVICYEKTGEGSPVILIHGNKGDHHTFDALAETMSNYHTVYAMDSRGYGESATPKEYHYKDMAEDVINLINALHNKPVHKSKNYSANQCTYSISHYIGNLKSSSST